VGGFAPWALEDSVRPRRLAGVVARPLNFTSKDFPVWSTVFSDFCFFRLSAEQKDRLRDSNRPLVSAQHSGPRVSRAPAPRSLASVFRLEVYLGPRAPV
jgi:hypothetical protein